MPTSRAQIIAARIAEHDPGKLNPENRGLLKMGATELHKFASASTKGKPQYAGLAGKRKKK
jgi:hypothetical protein